MKDTINTAFALLAFFAIFAIGVSLFVLPGAAQFGLISWSVVVTCTAASFITGAIGIIGAKITD